MVPQTLTRVPSPLSSTYPSAQTLMVALSTNPDGQHGPPETPAKVVLCSHALSGAKTARLRRLVLRYRAWGSRSGATPRSRTSSATLPG
eukprot:2304481-Rhodomonas_salina.1